MAAQSELTIIVVGFDNEVLVERFIAGKEVSGLDPHGIRQVRELLPGCACGVAEPAQHGHHAGGEGAQPEEAEGHDRFVRA